MHRKLFAGLAALAAVSAIIAVSPPAHADDWGPDRFPGVLFHADSAMHTYCYAAGFDNHRAIADEAMIVLADTTNMARSLQGDCDARDGTEDVWWWASNLDAGVRGQATCARLVTWDNSGTICESFDVRMDFPELDQGSNDVADRAKTACHELGHTVGLQHNTSDGADSCMVSGEVLNTDIKWRRYSRHHREDHINVRFTEPS